MSGPTLSDLLQYRESLFSALGSGARVVKDQNGEEVQFRGVSEIQRAIGIVESQIAALNSKASNVIQFRTRKGV